MTNVWKKVVLQAPIWQGLWKAGQMEFGDGSSRRFATHFVGLKPGADSADSAVGFPNAAEKWVCLEMGDIPNEIAI